jgi:hypothetical protein
MFIISLTISVEYLCSYFKVPKPLNISLNTKLSRALLSTPTHVGHVNYSLTFIMLFQFITSLNFIYII